MGNTTDDKDGNFPHLEKKPVTALSDYFEDGLREIVPRVLRDYPPKVVASRIKATPRTVKGWKAGEHMPQGHHLLALKSAFPEMRTEITRLEMMAGTNADAVSALSQRIFEAAMEKIRGEPA